MIVSGASVTGSAHLAAGRGCEDAFRAVRVGDDAVVLAVADGVGSRSRAALGAQLAVDNACRVLTAAAPPGRGASAQEWTGWIADRGALLAETCVRTAGALVPGEGTTEPGAAQAGAAQAGAAQAGATQAGATQPRAAEARSSQHPAAQARAAEAGTTEFGSAESGPAEGGVLELGAALLVACVRAPWVAFVSLGDCFGVVLTTSETADGAAGAVERAHLVLPPPAPGGPPPAYTTSPAARLRVRTFTLWEPELSGVVLATDGCAPLALDHPSVRGLPDAAGPLPSGRFFPPLAAALRRAGGGAEPLHALLSDPAAAARTGDDLTVLCALADGGRRWS
ncbi:protein phosphatase 2C domain-containing protein [Streptomyces sp. NPDC053493]|uniref:protein phosphatase 2C domain-containing protein n=1 Tax=Streptomyces sp. NPDC053493 TaxID=3365705 RepID=UPI0037CD6C88